MPLTYTEQNSNSRKLRFIGVRTWIKKIASKLFFGPLQTILVIFGILTLVFDLFSNISNLWYLAYIIFIIGYYMDRWVNPIGNNIQKNEEKDNKKTVDN